MSISKNSIFLLLTTLLLLSSCSDDIWVFPESRPHKEIKEIHWSSDGSYLLARVSIPISQYDREYKIYKFDHSGNFVEEYPTLTTTNGYIGILYFTSNDSAIVTEQVNVETFDIATSTPKLSLQDVDIVSKSPNSDTYIIAKEFENANYGPYGFYRRAKITDKVYEDESSIRILPFSTFSSQFPLILSKERILTYEYDSVNSSLLVLRDSAFNKIWSKKTNDNFLNRPPIIGSNAEAVLYVDSRQSVLLSLLDGSVDSNLPANLYYSNTILSSDGSKIYFTHYSGTDIQVFDVAARTTSTLIDIPSGTSVNRLIESPDGKYIAYSISKGDSAEQIVIAPIP